MTEVFSQLRENRSRGSASGLCSVCSSHALVIEAAVRLAGRTKKPLLIEATANQVNQHGGYSGLAPNAFVALVHRLCSQNAVDPELVLVGGDHLGPWPWKSTPAEPAMLKAEQMVRHFVRAGAMKIHLDASMALADDPGAALDPGRAASRAVRLCRAAEEESRFRGNARPVYVMGTEVPMPGGEVAAGLNESAPAPAPAPVPTRPGDFRETVALHQRLFHEAGLDHAWERVVAVVVQPGIEFDALTVHPYRRDLAAGLVRALADFPGLLFEGHSTDFQSTSALRALVEDGFAVLKVGPELTFTLREALFGLAAIEEELLGSSEEASRLKATVLEAMREKPESWKGYYKEDKLLPFRMTYGYSDRVRYYWNQPRVACAVDKLLANLGRAEIPPQLISQFLPHLPPAQDLPPAARTPRELLLAAVQAQLSRYIQACAPAPAPAPAQADPAEVPNQGGRT